MSKLKASVIIISTLIVVVVVAGLWGATFDLPLRHKPTGLNDQFYAAGKSFPDYIEDTKNRVVAARQKAGVTHADPAIENQIVAGRLPYEVAPKFLSPDQQGLKHKFKNGVLLIHGLGETPFEMRSYADYFLNRGFKVRSVLLPGHGTVPGDLTNIHYSEWEKAVEFGIESFKGEVDNLFLCGFSTGAALSAIKALEQSKNGTNRIRGVILSSPAIAIKIKSAFLSPLASRLSSFLKRIRMIRKEEDKSLYSYESFNINGGAQIYGLVKKFNKLRKEADIKVPIFSVSSMQDNAVDVAEAREIMYAIDNPNNSHILFTSGPVDLTKTSADVRVINTGKVIFGGRVVGYSHGALHVSPENPFFGRFGDYRFCPHYEKGSELRAQCEKDNPYITKMTPTCGRFYQDPEKLQACKENQIYLGSPTPENLDDFSPLRQLTYNENFKYVVAQLDYYFYKNKFLDPFKYQAYQFMRIQQARQAEGDLRKLLVNVYPNGDLASAIQELSLTHDISTMDSVDLRGTKVVDLKPLGKIENIKILNLGENNQNVIENRGHYDVYAGDGVYQVYQNLDTLSLLKKLELLKINGAKLDSIEPLKKLTKLKFLALNATNVTVAEYHELKKSLPNTEIYFHNALNASKGLFKNVMKVTGDDLGAALEAIKKRVELASISSLSITGTLRDKVIKNFYAVRILPGLRELELAYSRIDSLEGLKSLKGLESFSTVYVKTPNGGTKEVIRIVREASPTVDIRGRFETAQLLWRYINYTKKYEISLNDLVDFIDQDMGVDHIQKFVFRGEVVSSIIENRNVGFDLSGNKVRHMTNLDSITLDAYPGVDLTSFKGLKDVKHLDVVEGNVKDLSAMKDWVNLETMRLKKVSVATLEPLRNSTKLRLMKIRHVPISSIGPLQEMEKMKKLEMINTKVTNLEPLRYLKKLKELRIDFSPVVDLSPLENLTFGYLNIQGTRVTDIGAIVYHGRNRALYVQRTPFAKHFKDIKQTKYFE